MGHPRRLELTISQLNADQLLVEGELDKKSNVQNMHIAFSDKLVALYSLVVIISVGYRVKSQQGTRFREQA